MARSDGPRRWDVGRVVWKAQQRRERLLWHPSSAARPDGGAGAMMQRRERMQALPWPKRHQFSIAARALNCKTCLSAHHISIALYDIGRGPSV
jgi:hypothetical protein